MKADVRDLLTSVALVALLAVPIQRRFRQWHWSQCRNRMHRLGIVLEIYASEHGGRYPRSLSALPSQYRRLLGTCPVSGSDYSEVYPPASDQSTCRLLWHLHGAPPENL